MMINSESIVQQMNMFRILMDAESLGFKVFNVPGLLVPIQIILDNTSRVSTNKREN